MDSDALNEAVRFLQSRAGRDGADKLLIARHARVVFAGDRCFDVQRVWSVTKSVLSTVAGLLFDRGRIDLDQPVAEHLPALAGNYPRVTLRHLLTMSSGYSAVGDDPQPGYAHGPSRTPFRPATPRFTPGERFEYWDSAANLLGKVLARAAGQPLDELFRRCVADPIGMDPAGWSWGTLDDEEGGTVVCGAGNYAAFCVNAWTLWRIGQLYLNRGVWDGRRILSERWVELALSFQIDPSPRPGGYGLMWWTNRNAAGTAAAWPSAPTGAFCAIGYNNNRLLVVPEWHLVVVRLGLDQDDRQMTYDDFDGFLRRLKLDEP